MKDLSKFKSGDIVHIFFKELIEIYGTRYSSAIGEIRDVAGTIITLTPGTFILGNGLDWGKPNNFLRLIILSSNISWIFSLDICEDNYVKEYYSHKHI